MGTQDEETTRRKFNVEAVIQFVTSIGNELDPEVLSDAVFQADKAAPWRSRDVSGAEAPSIHWHSSVDMREGEGIDRMYGIRIRPPFLLAYGQLHAYQNYAENLGKTLADRRLVGVTAVAVRVVFSGTYLTYRSS